MINLDMDGVLAKFLFGTPFAKLFVKWYFLFLPPQTNIVEAVKKLSKKYDIGVCSAYLEKSRYALKEKKSWLRAWIPEIPETNWKFLPCGQSKGVFVKSPGDLLIDDRWVHGEEWINAGGKFVKVSVNEKDWLKEKERYEFCIHPDMPPNDIIDVIERRIHA